MHDIRNLILTLLFGVVAAFGVAAFFVLNYGPSGNYTVGQTLLSPELLAKLNYNDYNPKTGGQDRFIFDVIEYSWFDEEKGEWQKRNIDETTYSQIYNLIERDKSLNDVPSLKNDHSSKISLFVRTESSSEWQAQVKTFQIIEFVADDYYRIELHEDNPGTHWAYFNHPKVRQAVFKIVNP